MNYSKIYDSLILKCKERGSVEGYKESHHILPKSMGGGNDPENLVVMTAREHFIAHALLAKIYKGPMSIALWRMCNFRNGKYRGVKVNSHIFKYARESFAVEISARFKGKPRPQWVKDKISQALTGRVFTDKWRLNISVAQTGVKKGPMSQSQKESISKRMKGKGNHRFGLPSSDKQKASVSAANKGKKSHRYNHKKLHFVHSNGEERVCTQYELRKEFNMSHGNLSMLCNGKRQTCAGWRVLL